MSLILFFARSHPLEGSSRDCEIQTRKEKSDVTTHTSNRRLQVESQILKPLICTYNWKFVSKTGAGAASDVSCVYSWDDNIKGPFVCMPNPQAIKLYIRLEINF